MPTVLRTQGFRLYFWSREPNEPPHVHVDRAGATAKLWLEPAALASNIGYSAHANWAPSCAWSASINPSC